VTVEGVPPRAAATGLAFMLDAARADTMREAEGAATRDTEGATEAREAGILSFVAGVGMALVSVRGRIDIARAGTVSA
jgi:hypothetical protein